MSFIVLKKEIRVSNFVLGLIFLYFFTTSADLLHVQLPLFRVKANHLLAIILSSLLLLKNHKWQLDRRLFVGLFCVAISMVLSLFQSAYLPRSLAHGAIFVFTAFMYFFLPLNLISIYGHECIFRLYRWSFLATGIFAALQFFSSFVGIAFPFVSQHLLGTVARGQAMAFEPSYFALYMSAFVMYWNAKQLTQEKRNWVKMILINLLLLVSTSTGAFFSYFFFLLVVLVFQRISWIRDFKKIIFRKILYVMGVLAFVFLGFFFLAPDLFTASFWKFFTIGFLSHQSFAERWQGIMNAWELFLAHPWFGVGIGGIGPRLYKEYFAQEFLSGPSIAMMELYDPTNVLTELFAALGLTGALACSFFMFQYCRRIFQIAKLATLEERKELYALLVSLCVMLLIWQFNQNLFRSYVWVHAALCMGYALSLISKKGD